jgi:DNA excision repair protein ERCC-5
MGVQSLWNLLSPHAETVSQPSLLNKRLAIDASIWLHQFHAIKQDPKFQLQGFLKRIIKLRFWGVKPVIVFDGGVPGIKRNTIMKR